MRKYKKILQRGDIRYKKRFAFLPQHIENQRIWLESYYERWEYSGGNHWWFLGEFLPENLTEMKNRDK